MNKKKVIKGFYIVIVSFAVCVLICTIGFSKNDPRQSLKEVIEVYRKGGIDRLECYYSTWGNPGTFTSEEELLKGRYDYKVIVKLALGGYMKELESKVEEFKFDKVDLDADLDHRMSFQFINKSDDVALTITFASNEPVMLINGQPYKASNELMELLLPILPNDAYDYFIKMKAGKVKGIPSF